MASLDVQKSVMSNPYMYATTLCIEERAWEQDSSLSYLLREHLEVPLMWLLQECEAITVHRLKRTYQSTDAGSY